jgi:hypothetical protein
MSVRGEKVRRLRRLNGSETAQELAAGVMRAAVGTGPHEPAGSQAVPDTRRRLGRELLVALWVITITYYVPGTAPWWAGWLIRTALWLAIAAGVYVLLAGGGQWTD